MSITPSLLLLLVLAPIYEHGHWLDQLLVTGFLLSLDDVRVSTGTALIWLHESLPVLKTDQRCLGFWVFAHRIKHPLSSTLYNIGGVRELIFN